MPSRAADFGHHSAEPQADYNQIKALAKAGFWWSIRGKRTGRWAIMIRVFRNASAALALAMAALGATSASAQVAGVPMEQQQCQRTCLEGFVNRYLQAMADGTVDPDLFAP